MLRLPDPVFAPTSIEARRTGQTFLMVVNEEYSSGELTPESQRACTLMARVGKNGRFDPINRTRLLTALSAWFTLAQMERFGWSFDEFIELATSDDAVSRVMAVSIWGELGNRLMASAVEALGDHPEAVLSPEVRKFIEALMSATPELP